MLYRDWYRRQEKRGKKHLNSVVQEAEDIALAIMPFFHVYGMNGLMNLGIYLAATLVLIPQPEIKTIVEAIVAERPTFFVGIPALFVALNNYRSFDKIDLTSIKAMFSGAAPLPVDVMEKFESRTGARIAEAYGMTESSSVTHVNPRKGQRKVGSIGVPIIGTDAQKEKKQYVLQADLVLKW